MQYLSGTKKQSSHLLCSKGPSYYPYPLFPVFLAADSLAFGEFLQDAIEKKKLSQVELLLWQPDFFFSAVVRNSLTCVQRLSCGISLLAYITNSANCSNYMKRSLLARKAIMLFLNSLHSIAFINYACLQIHNHQIIHLRPHTTCPETLSKFAVPFHAGWHSYMAHRLYRPSPALQILKIEIKIRME